MISFFSVHFRKWKGKNELKMNDWLTCSRRALGWLLKKNPALTSLSQFRMRLLEKRPGSTPDIGTLKYFFYNSDIFTVSSPAAHTVSHADHISVTLPGTFLGAEQLRDGARLRRLRVLRRSRRGVRPLQRGSCRGHGLEVGAWAPLVHVPRDEVRIIPDLILLQQLKYFCCNSRYFYLALQDVVDVVAAARLGEAAHSRHWNEDTLIRRHF